MKWFLLLCSVGLSAASWDGCCPVECQPSSWFAGSWEGSVSALYWKPDNGGFQIGSIFEQGPPTSASIRELKPDYQWGVRGSGLFSRTGGCSFLELSGLWIRGNDHSSISGSLFAVFGLPANIISGESRHEYWNIDFRIGQILFEGSKFAWRAFGGIRYANFDFQQKLVATNFSSGIFSFAQDARFYGVGPEMGVHATFPIWRCVDFIGSGTFVALVGERSTRIDSRLPFVTRTRFPRATVIAPGFDLLVAARLRLHWNSLLINSELGYEMNHVWNAYNMANFSNPAPNVQFIRRAERDIGWAGPYLRVGIGF